jgi:hypothetical protein
MSSETITALAGGIFLVISAIVMYVLIVYVSVFAMVIYSFVSIAVLLSLVLYFLTTAAQHYER